MIKIRSHTKKQVQQIKKRTTYKKKNTPTLINSDEDSNSLCDREVRRLEALFSEVEISPEEISEKVETIYVLSPPYCNEIILYKPPPPPPAPPPHTPPASLGTELPWPSPRSTCCKASQFAAHFVLDIKVERVRASDNNMHWHLHEFQWKTNRAQGKEQRAVYFSSEL